VFQEVSCWHLASFRCDAEFGRLSAHIAHREVIKLDLWVRALVLPAEHGSRLKSRPAQFLLESSLPECIRLRIACFLGIFWI
jgi:hypothetical protein